MMGQWNKPDERLLIYYAGHGFTNYNASIRNSMGYITGRDTPAGESCSSPTCQPYSAAISNAIPMQELNSLSLETQARQVIMLFDSCFSGSIFMSRSSDTDPKKLDYFRALDAISKPVSYYITAGGANEQIPADSPFAKLVLSGLRGEADIYHDGYITGEQFGAYLQRNLPRVAGVALRIQKGRVRNRG